MEQDARALDLLVGALGQPSSFVEPHPRTGREPVWEARAPAAIDQDVLDIRHQSREGDDDARGTRDESAALWGGVLGHPGQETAAPRGASRARGVRWGRRFYI